MLRIIQRQVIYDLIKVSMLSFVAASSLLMMVLVMVQAARNCLDPFRVLMIMPYLIPPTMVYTIPTCLLFACTVVFSGMSRNNEITALKSSGIHVFRILWPAVTLSVLLSAAGVYLADRVIPQFNKQFRQLLIDDLEATMYAYLAEQGELVRPGFPYEVYVQNVDGRQLIDPIIKHRKKVGGGYDMIMQAERGMLSVVESEEDGVLPTLVLRMLVGTVVTDSDDVVHFRDREESMQLPDAVDDHSHGMETKNFAQCLEKSRAHLESVRELNAKLAADGAEIMLGGNPGAILEKQRRTTSEIAVRKRKSRTWGGEVHVRIAQATAGLPFVLLGCPVSILFRRRDFLQSFFICYLPVIFLFYPAMILAFNFYKEGDQSLFVIWAPTTLMVLLSLPLMRRLVRF